MRGVYKLWWWKNYLSVIFTWYASPSNSKPYTKFTHNICNEMQNYQCHITFQQHDWCIICPAIIDKYARESVAVHGADYKQHCSRAFPANTSRWPNADLMLDQRLRRRLNIKPALFAGFIIWLVGCEGMSRLLDIHMQQNDVIHSIKQVILLYAAVQSQNTVIIYFSSEQVLLWSAEQPACSYMYSEHNFLNSIKNNRIAWFLSGTIYIMRLQNAA